MKNTLLNKFNKLPKTSGLHGGEWVSGQEEILNDAKRYIEATNEGRLFAIVRSVSKSGESRVIDFGEFVQSENSSNGETYGLKLNFARLFEFLGYKYTEDKQGYRISGGGMDMIFHVHDTTIRNLVQLGVLAKGELITEEELTLINKLAQKQPINL